jgi:hypothetical protein
MKIFLFIGIVLVGGILAIVALKRMRNPFRASFAILPEHARRAFARVKQTTDGLPNLKSGDFRRDRTRRGDLQITHRDTGYWCVLVGQHSARYSPDKSHRYRSLETTSFEEQLDVIDAWLGALSVQVAAIDAEPPWWIRWPFQALRRRSMRLLYIARVALHYTLRNSAPLVVFAVLGLLVFAITAESCCGSASAGLPIQSCCSLPIDCQGQIGPFSLPSFRAGAAWSDVREQVGCWGRLLIGVPRPSPCLD